MARVLLVDDDDLARDTFQEMLEQAGYDVEAVSNGEEGLVAFRKVLADVVVTDILMPVKDGVEFIRELKKEFPDVKIIAITGMWGRYNRLPAASNLGAQYTLTKPFGRQELVDAVEDLLGGKASKG